MKLRNIYLALKDQGPFRRAWRNFVITGNAKGIFHINSHISTKTGESKVKYNTKETANPDHRIDLYKKYLNSDIYTINYNLWFSEYEYRRQIEKDLGLTSDIETKHTPKEIYDFCDEISKLPCEEISDIKACVGDISSFVHVAMDVTKYYELE